MLTLKVAQLAFLLKDLVAKLTYLLGPEKTNPFAAGKIPYVRCCVVVCGGGGGGGGSLLMCHMTIGGQKKKPGFNCLMRRSETEVWRLFLFLPLLRRGKGLTLSFLGDHVHCVPQPCALWPSGKLPRCLSNTDAKRR